MAPPVSPSLPQTPVQQKPLRDVAVLTSPLSLAYLGSAFVLSVMLALGLFLPLGLSARSNAVFAVEAAISGVVADLIFRAYRRERFVLSRKFRVPMLYAWPVLALMFVLSQPVEQATQGIGTIANSPSEAGTAVSTRNAEGARQQNLRPITESRSTGTSQTVPKCGEREWQVAAELYAIAVAFPDDLPSIVEQNTELIRRAHPETCLASLSEALTSQVISMPSPSQVRETAMDIASRSGAPELGEKLANDMQQPTGQLWQVATYTRSLAGALPNLIEGDLSAYHNSAVYQDMAKIWELLIYLNNMDSGVRLDLPKLRQLSYRMNIWSVRLFSGYPIDAPHVNWDELVVFNWDKF